MKSDAHALICDLWVRNFFFNFNFYNTLFIRKFIFLISFKEAFVLRCDNSGSLKLKLRYHFPSISIFHLQTSTSTGGIETATMSKEGGGGGREGGRENFESG